MRIILNIALHTACAATVLVAALLAGAATANERHFAFTYESAVLPPLERELEIWTTPRMGRDTYFLAFDSRVELELGLTDRLMTAFYLNGSAHSRQVGAELERSFEFGGISSEWKYKLFDPVADPLGLALYGEVTWALDEVALELKVILDRRLGPLLLAANLSVEEALALELGGVGRETDIEVDLAAAYFLSEHLTVGLELRNLNQAAPGPGWLYSTLYLGPTLAYSSASWWVALSLQPQLPALRRRAADAPLVLDVQERFDARLLFSVHL